MPEDTRSDTAPRPTPAAPATTPAPTNGNGNGNNPSPLPNPNPQGGTRSSAPNNLGNRTSPPANGNARGPYNGTLGSGTRAPTSTNNNGGRPPMSPNGGNRSGYAPSAPGSAPSRPGGYGENRAPGGPSAPSRGPSGPNAPSRGTGGPSRGPGRGGPGGGGGGFGGPSRGGPSGGPNRGPSSGGGYNRGPSGPSRGGSGRGGGTAGAHGRGRPGSRSGGPSTPRAPVKTKPTGPITLPSTMMVKDLAETLEATTNEVIMKLIGQGIFANVNQVIDYKVAALVATELGFEPSEAATVSTISAAKTEMISTGAGSEAPRLARPPIVVVMGHVDHGKTSLLDAIRKTKVAAGEAGGITQHIGAYQVETTDGRPVTFLDTPGHEAFTAMRARGAKATDVAVIVVAADDGVMPQTIEAIDHARAAQVPILVALNKIDKPNANPEYVKNQLAEMGVVIEDYGGDVVMAEVSAKKGIGIEALLEMILLVADVQDLKANPKGHAIGTVLEARVDRSSGIVANMLVQDGTLKIGDNIVVGTISGKVRAMFNDTGERIKVAGPSTPVSVLGLGEVPTAGDQFVVVADERAARQLIEQHRIAEIEANAVVTLDTLYTQMQQGKVKELNLVLKADVQGSLDALRQVLGRLGNDQFKVRLIHEGVGNISETDVHLASASRAIIIGFNTKPDGAALRVAQNEHVDIRFYDVIYKLVDEIEAALKGMLEPVYKDVVEGHAEVLQLFKAGKVIIGGCKVTDGKISRSSTAKVLRAGKPIFTGTLGTLRRGKDDAREINTGFECGLTLDDFNDLQVGDVIETTIKVRV